MNDNDHNPPRDIRDYTSRIDLNNNYDRRTRTTASKSLSRLVRIDIAQPAGAELTKILTTLREVTSRDIGIVLTLITPAAEHTSDGQQPAVNNSSRSPEVGTAGAHELRARQATFA